jgi:hypothetical protein
MSDIFRFENGVFTRKAGSLRQIAAGNSHAVWGVDDDSRVFTWNGQVFQLLIGRPGHPVPRLDLVRVAATGQVWGIDTNKGLVFHDPNQGFLPIRVDGLQSFRNLAVGSGFAWAITDSGTYLLEEDGTFKKFDLPLQTISCGQDSNAWGVNTQGDVFFFDGDKGAFQKLEGITLNSIAVGASFPGRNELQVWGLKLRDQPNSLIQEHDIFRAFLTHDEKLFAFGPVPGELMLVSAASGDVWGINALHEIFQFNPAANHGSGAFVKRDPGTQWTAVSEGFDDVWALATPQPPIH